MYSYLHYSNFYHFNKCLRRLVKSKEHLMIDHLLAKKKMYNYTCLAKYLCRGAANHSRVAEDTRLSLEGVYSGIS